MNDSERQHSVDPTTKLAIIGMDAFWGSCNNLNTFERSIFDGKQQFIPLPSWRWQGLEPQVQRLQKAGLSQEDLPLGAYLPDLTQMLPNALNQGLVEGQPQLLSWQDQLIQWVATQALQDAAIPPGTRVAVILTRATQLSIQQLQHPLNPGMQALQRAIASGMETVAAGGQTPPAVGVAADPGLGSYPNPLDNNIANQIRAEWQFSGPAFTLTAECNSVFKALEIAANLLTTGAVEAVLVGAVDLVGCPERVLLNHHLGGLNPEIPSLSYDRRVKGWMIGEGAGAIVLQRSETARNQGKRIYAVIEALSLEEICSNSPARTTLPLNPEGVNQICQRAFQAAGIHPQQIDYLEVFGSGIADEDEAEILGLARAYQAAGSPLTCAIGSVKTLIGHTWGASGLDSLIKTALCLYHRYIPATPQWSAPKPYAIAGQEIWADSPFYVPTESRPWTLAAGHSRRIAGLSGIGQEGTYTHLILSEDIATTHRLSTYLEQTPFYLFAIAAENRDHLSKKLRALEANLENCSSLSTAAYQAFLEFQEHRNAPYALTLLGHNREQLQGEIQHAQKGINDAFEQGKIWQTPVGSYFTANPFGRTGKIAYVYPGAYSAYLGLGRTLTRLFPQLWDSSIYMSLKNHYALVAHLLYPRGLQAFSQRQLESLEQKLIDNPLDMLETEIGYAGLMTTIVKDYFQIPCQIALGYSLGEISMMYGQQVWRNFDEAGDVLRSSALFRDRIIGQKVAVRQFWQLPEEYSEEFWSTYLLIADLEQVRERVAKESRVYLTQINTPKEMVIAGDPQACSRVIDQVQGAAFRAPYNHVIHCQAIASEYSELARLNTHQSQQIPETKFYSAAEYAPISLEGEAIGQNIARNLCHQLDFPRLIECTYEDEARIFLEVGAGSNCSRWIGEILKQKEHVTIVFNRRGVDEHTSILQGLSKLISHRVSVNLSPLYPLLKGESSIKFSMDSQSRTGTADSCKTETSLFPDKTILPHPSGASSQNLSALDTTTKTPCSAPNPITSSFQNSQYHLLQQNSSYMTQVNLNLSRERQKALQQLSQLIHLQFNLYQQLNLPINSNNCQENSSE